MYTQLYVKSRSSPTKSVWDMQPPRPRGEGGGLCMDAHTNWAFLQIDVRERGR